MSNNVHPRVPTVHIRDDGDLVLIVEVVDIDPGKWADISGYIIQEDVIQGGVIQERGKFVPFSAIQMVPLRQNDVSFVTVNVAAAGLTTGRDVKVVARTTEAQIWPTVLSEATAVTAVSGIAATWQARNDAAATTTTTMGGYPHGTAPATVSNPSIPLGDMQPGYEYHITIEVVPK